MSDKQTSESLQGIRACGEWTYSDLTDLLDLQGIEEIKIQKETKVETPPECVHHIPGTLSASLVIPPHSGAEQADGEAGDDQQRADCRHR